MAGSLFLLLPPSEAKEIGGSAIQNVDTFGFALGDSRREVLEAVCNRIHSSARAHQESLFHARGALLTRALDSWHELESSRATFLPSWRRYQGTVWKHLDAPTLGEHERRRILIPTSLYGISTGEDWVADFRLKMSASVAPLGNIATFWRERLTPVLATHVKGGVLVNLLPLEHVRAFDVAALGRDCELLTIHFVAHDDNRVVGHDAKAVKGLVARHLLIHGIEELSAFSWRGWNVREISGETYVVAPQ